MQKEHKTALFVATLTAFATTFSASALTLSIPAIGAEFGFGAASIGWIVTGYVLASAILSVPFGRIADLTGRKWVLCVGILIFTLFSLLILITKSPGAFLTFRVVQGVGAAMIFATNQAVLIAAFPPATRGKVLGYYIAATYTGLTAGPVIGGILNHQFGWRSIFLLGFAMGAAAFAVALLKLPASGVYKGTDKMDVIGSILYVISTGMILYGFSSLTTEVEAKYLLMAGTLIFVFFILRESKISHPVIKVRLFRSNPAYLFSNLAALLNYGATFALGYWLSIYLQLVKGMDSQAAGWVLVSQPLMMALLSPMAGRLSDRIAPYRLASFGMALCAAGLIPFVFVTETMPMTLIVACLLTVGVGFALFSSPNVNAVMACVEPADYGVASSILATMRSIGHSFSMAVVTLIVADRIGNIPLASADTSLITEAMRISFVVFTLLCFLGIYFSMRRRK